MFRFVLVEPDKTASIHHLGSEQPRSAEFTNDLPKRRVRKPGHRCLQNRGIDDQVTDTERSSRDGDGSISLEEVVQFVTCSQAHAWEHDGGRLPPPEYSVRRREPPNIPLQGGSLVTSYVKPASLAFRQRLVNRSS